jgi:transglutaminase-like putative cysteine protease
MHRKSQWLTCCLIGLFLFTFFRDAGVADARQTSRVSCSWVYAVTPGRDTTRAVLTVLVPATLPGKQRVVRLRYSRKPSRVFRKGGNTYARFYLVRPRRPLRITVSAILDVYECDLAVAAERRGKWPSVSRSRLKKYLAHEKYLEKNHPAIRAVARRLRGRGEVDTVRRIMAYVHKTLRYSGWYRGKPTFGAVGALRKRHGVCTEFTDLFVALCRARNIPARACEGSMTTPVRKTDTPHHAWAEVYFRAHGWVIFDPLHSSFRTPHTTFERVPANRVCLTTVRNDSLFSGGHRYMFRHWGGKATVKDTYHARPLNDRSLSTKR